MWQPTGHAAFRQGRPVALADACWHRSAPLSPGKLRADDEIMCGYRGSCYDANGRATFQSLDAAVGAGCAPATWRWKTRRATSRS
jgi:phenylpropionate dioxygenase-like ring-hydroxylating dioxygenase large terminal subunit